MNSREDFALGKAPPAAQYVYNLLLHGSQTLSVILGGDPDESVSSRLGKAQKAGKKWARNYACPFVDFITNEKDHCEKAIETDEGQKQIWDWSK